MGKKIRIDVICGFLEAGKTTLLGELLRAGGREAPPRQVILCCEQGEVAPDEALLARQNAKLLCIDSPQELTCELFERIAHRLEPERILIEYNGTWSLDTLLRLPLPRRFTIGRIVHVADGAAFPALMAGTGDLLPEQIANCDQVIVNRAEPEKRDNIRQLVRNINRRARVEFAQDYTNPGAYRAMLARSLGEAPAGASLKVFVAIALILLAHELLNLLRLPLFADQLTLVQAVNTMFLGVLMQAIPFVLIGVFISSVLQIFVPDTLLTRAFAKGRILGFPLAVVLGVFFPVCDCALAPVAARLVKKGVPLPQAATFLLAAPAVNPIVIFSTLMAFPGQPMIALYRVLLGIIIALAAGITLCFLPKVAGNAVRSTAIGPACASGYLGKIRGEGMAGRVEAVFRHAGMEFLNVGKYVVVGALISAVIQATVPREAVGALGTGVLSLLVMMGAAFLMSVCSSSNAFIARSFLTSLPLSPVLAFMVMGPMLDLKNLLMLSGSFSRRFVLALVGILLAASLLIFTLVPMLIPGGLAA